MTAPRISVVITVHNAARVIGATLRGIMAQPEYATGDMQIVVVDDRSTDGTASAALAEGLPETSLIRIETAGTRGLTTRQEALERGILEARGEAVLIVDDDAVVAPDWAASMAEPILSGRADAVAGPVHYRNGWLGRWQSVDVAFYLMVCKVLNALGLASGALFTNFAFRREFYARTGGFPKIGFTLTEDLAYARALHRAGARIVFGAAGPAEFDACESWTALIRRAKRISAGGSSLLAAVLGIWMVLFVALGVAGLLFGGVFAWLFLARWAAGAVFTVAAVARVGRGRLWPLALLYDPLTIAIGVMVMVGLARDGKVEWGGVNYAR